MLPATRSEIQNSGGEKGELSRKLRSIQDKVAEIESSHAVEINSLMVRCPLRSLYIVR
jgi:hypothetical protein